MADPGDTRGCHGRLEAAAPDTAPAANPGANPGALLIAIAGAVLLAGCGNTGDLYLPQESATGEIVTRPTQTPPPDPSESSNSPQSVDSPPRSPNPAPEVTAPEKDDSQDDPDPQDEEKKKEPSGNPPR